MELASQFTDRVCYASCALVAKAYVRILGGSTNRVCVVSATPGRVRDMVKRTLQTRAIKILAPVFTERHFYLLLHGSETSTQFLKPIHVAVQDTRELAYKVLFDIGPLLSRKVQLVSFHTVSKGYWGECGQRSGYFEMTNLPPKMGVMVNPPKPGDISYLKFAAERLAASPSLSL